MNVQAYPKTRVPCEVRTGFRVKAGHPKSRLYWGWGSELWVLSSLTHFLCMASGSLTIPLALNDPQLGG